MKNSPKVLILYNKLLHYRIPIWNILAEKCHLTVAYTMGDQALAPDCKFDIVKLPYKIIAKHFVWHTCNISRLCSSFDVILIYGDMAWIKYIFQPWVFFKKYSVIFWSIGVSASYSKHFDEVRRWDAIRLFLFNRANALVFYSDYPVEKYARHGVSRSKLFVAHNTVMVKEKNEPDIPKNSILFIGSLYPQKGILDLLIAYRNVHLKGYALPVLNILGDGTERAHIQKWIIDNKLAKLILLFGAIYDINEKAKFFSKSLACISPKQAGLAVQESFGYGVPFITESTAYTGGEIFDITNNETGLLLTEKSSLEDALIQISQDPDKFILMGKRAKQFYESSRTPEHMANGLWNAIQHVYSINSITKYSEK